MSVAPPKKRAQFLKKSAAPSANVSPTYISGSVRKYSGILPSGKKKRISSSEISYLGVRQTEGGGSGRSHPGGPDLNGTLVRSLAGRMSFDILNIDCYKYYELEANRV